MTDDGVWATEAEILATAAALNTDIFIFCKVGVDIKSTFINQLHN
jgi:hypothetical protein